MDDLTLDVIAERIFREAAGDRDRALHLALELVTPTTGYGVYRILTRKFAAEDAAAVDAIAERCHREANGDRRLGYQLVADYTADRHGFFGDNVRNRFKQKFIADTTSQLNGDRIAAAQIETRKEATAGTVGTRARRRSKLIHETANGILDGKKFGPRSSCWLCRKLLTGPVSINRGIAQHSDHFPDRFRSRRASGARGTRVMPARRTHAQCLGR